MDRGVIYVVTGDIKFIQECLFSVASLKRHCPDLPVTLFTDRPGIEEGCFDRVILIQEDVHPLKNKVRYLWRSPYDYTLFLDSDTQLKGPIHEMFDWLYDYDLGLANAPQVDWSRRPYKLLSYVNPDTYNTGVVLYRKSEEVEKLFRKWFEYVMSQDGEDMWPGHNCDQQYFNRLIREDYHLECGVKLGVFPNKVYNVRLPMIRPLKRDGEIERVKIVHCHNLHLSLSERVALNLTHYTRRLLHR